MARRKKSQTQQQVEEVLTESEVPVEVVEEKASEPKVVEEPVPVVEEKVETPKPTAKKQTSSKKEVEIVKGRKYSISGAECVFVESKGDKLVVRMTADNTYRKVLKSDLS